MRDAENIDELIEELHAFMKAGQADPGNPDPHFQSGLIFSRMGDYVSAAKAYSTATEIDPTFAQAHFNLGNAYSAQRMWDEAEHAYRRAVRLRDTDFEAWSNLGSVYEALERPDDALASYRKAVLVEPREQAARQRTAQILIARSDWAGAYQVMGEAVDQDSSDQDAWNLLGLIAARQGQLEQARNLYLKAIAVDDGFSGAWNNLGTVFARMGQYQAAEEAYLAAVQREPGDVDAWYNLGEFYLTQGDSDAEKALLKVIELNRHDMEAWELLRQWYQKRPNYPVWQQALKVLLAARPDDLSLLRESAHVHQQLGKTDAALKELQQLITLDEHDEKARTQLAQLYEQLGRPLESFAQLERLTTPSETVLALRYRVGERLLAEGHRNEAESCYLYRVNHVPQDARAWQALGRLAQERNQPDVAYERFIRATSLNRNDARLWGPLAEAFLTRGDPPRALECLAQMVECLRLLPESWDLFYRAHNAAGRGERLLKQLEALLLEGWVAGTNWVRLADLYTAARMPEQAQAALAQLDEKTGNSPAARIALARRSLIQQDAAGALKLLNGIPEDARNSLEYWSVCGEAYYSQGGHQEARWCFERARELGGLSFRACFQLGNLYFRGGLFKEALDAFGYAVRKEPTQPKGWYNLALCQDALGLQPLESLNKALRLDRRFSAAWNAYGVAQFHRGQDALAQRGFLRAVATQRDSILGWGNLATVYRRMGKEHEAQRCQRQLERLEGKAPQQDAGSAVRLSIQ